MGFFKISNINGRFDYIQGREAAVARMIEIEGDVSLTESDLLRDYGWTITEVDADTARSVGFDI